MFCFRKCTDSGIGLSRDVTSKKRRPDKLVRMTSSGCAADDAQVRHPGKKRVRSNGISDDSEASDHEEIAPRRKRSRIIVSSEDSDVDDPDEIINGASHLFSIADLSRMGHLFVKDAPSVGVNCKRGRRKWAASYDPAIKGEFPWLLELSDEEENIIGVLCEVCRELYRKDPKLFKKASYRKSKGKFVNRPNVKPWGSLKENCKKHAKSILHSEITVGNVVGGAAEEKSLPEKNLDSMCFLNNKVVMNIHTRTSCQKYLKRQLDQDHRWHRESPTVFHLMDEMKYGYISPKGIADLHRANFLTVHLGILREMSDSPGIYTALMSACWQVIAWEVGVCDVGWCCNPVKCIF